MRDALMVICLLVLLFFGEYTAQIFHGFALISIIFLLIEIKDKLK